MKVFFKLFIVLTTLNFSGFSQESDLELSKIMAGNDFIGHQPQNIYWSAYGDKVYFDWQSDSLKEEKLHQIDVNTKEISNVADADKEKVVFYSPKLIGKNNFFYTYKENLNFCQTKDRKSDLKIQSSAQKKSLQHVNDEQVVYFIQNENLFKFNNELAQLKQVTNFKTEEDKPSDKSENFLTSQEKQFFKHFESTPEQKDKSSQLPSPIYIGDRKLNSIAISPNESFLMFITSEKVKNKNTEIMEYINSDGYSKLKKARPKVGTVSDSKFELSVYIPENDSVSKLDFSMLSGLRKRPVYQSEYGLTSDLERDKAIIIHTPKFNNKGDKALISVKSFDNKDRWLLIYNQNDGKLTEIEHQHDEAWIGGPGISNWNYYEGNIGWMNDDQHIYFQSEESGYSHLYLKNINTLEKKVLTKGAFEIHKAQLSKDGNSFYITANKTHPGNRSFYKLKWKENKWIDILTKDGYYDVSISPDESMLAVKYSYINKPWELYLGKNIENTKLEQVTFSTTEKFERNQWHTPEIISFRASDGTKVNARLYKPKAEVKNNAAIIFVHGAGYLQNAHNWWSTYFREFMFHNLLIDLGYTILDIDYRGSKGYGRDHRTAIYRHMGDKDLTDQIDGKRWLVKNQGIKNDKVGIYGGSYGGFITLMAMLKTPNEFQCGGALRSVADWAHYNHGYTSNILNTPEEDSIAYQRSSPIYFAEGLENRLIMFHGMVDDNVQYQDVVRLSQRFIELGKPSWDLISYPIESHGFKTTNSWTDEYRRLLDMFNFNLLEDE
ncbi:MAG: prolyl oligopeptidase family serine peptidase [Brumimicrobium sp.]